MAPPFPSALLVEVPESEPVVGTHRLRLDPVAARGVPAHVTALFPFIPRDDLDDVVFSTLARVAAAHDPFDYVFSTTAWFDTDVLYLAPDEPTPFRGLTRALVREWPEYPPYEGLYDDLTPHLTVALANDEDLRPVEAQLRAGLPVTGRAEHLTLLTENDEGRWSVRRRFPLGG